MYIGEYLLWFGNSIKKETRKKLEMSYSSSDMKLSEVEKDWTKASVSNNPRAIGPYYAYNDRYLEIRGGMFENFRGILTWISLLIFFIPLTSGFNFIYSIRVLFNNQTDEIGGYVITLIFFWNYLFYLFIFMHPLFPLCLSIGTVYHTPYTGTV